MRIVVPGVAQEFDRSVLDIVYIALILALFALFALVATGVERWGPRSQNPSPRDAATGEERP